MSVLAPCRIVAGIRAGGKGPCAIRRRAGAPPLTLRVRGETTGEVEEMARWFRPERRGSPVRTHRAAGDQNLATIFPRVLQLRAVAAEPNRFSRYADERVIALTPFGVQTYASVPSIAMTSGLWFSSTSVRKDLGVRSLVVVDLERARDPSQFTGAGVRNDRHCQRGLALLHQTVMLKAPAPR